MSDVDSLVRQLDSGDPAARRQAAEKLAGLGGGARNAAVPLVRGVDSDDETLRQFCVGALEQLGPPPDSDLIELIGLLGQDRELSAYWSATLIGRLGENGKRGDTALAEALDRSRHVSVRERAAWALGRAGSRSPAARSALERAAKSTSARLARLAREALERCGDSG